MKKKKSILYFVIFSFIFVFFFFLTIFLLANRHWFYPYETVIEYKYDSAKDDRIDELKDALSKLFFNGDILPKQEIYITNLRHKELLQKVYDSLKLVDDSISKNLSEDFTSTYNTMPWKAIAGMRDVFAHHYGSIDYEMTWNTSTDDITQLKAYLLEIS